MNLQFRKRAHGRRLRPALILLLAALSLSACGRDNRPPTVIIGLDGADFNLLVPWLEQGELPHLKALLDESAVGPLETVYPILSPVCWTSAATGVNPGKHGIFDFQKPDPDGGDPLLETATYRRAQPIWMLLSDAGYRVAVMNVPMTYPPDPVRGVMIAGFPFPSGDVNITYPPELNDELDDYPLDFLMGLSLFTRTPEEMHDAFLHGLEARRKVALDWVKSGKYDFLWMVFTGPDKVQHFFWKDMDPNHPSHDPQYDATRGEYILELWKKQDDALGELLAALPEDATVLVMSDHGFDGVYRQMNLGNFLQYDTDFPEWVGKHAVPPLWVSNGILHYNLKGQLVGATDREPFLDKFIGLFDDVKDPATGQNPIESMFRREDIYQGRMVAKAPDVIIQESPHYMVVRGEPDSLALPVFQDIWSTSFSAHHRPLGVVALRSPVVRTSTRGSIAERLAAGGDFRDANIMDITPTLLALLDQTIPQAMDGRVLDEVISPEFWTEHPVDVREVEGFLLERLPPSELSEEDKERYRAIPYIN